MTDAKPARKRRSTIELDPARAKRIVAALRVGETIERACAYGGVTRKTYYEWVKRGAKSKSPKDPYARFCADASEALADCRVGLLTTIQQHGRKEWQACAWILERRWPEEFARRRVEVTGPDGAPVPVSGANGGAIPVEGTVTVYLPDNGRGRVGSSGKADR